MSLDIERTLKELQKDDYRLYRDILQAFPALNPSRKKGEGAAFQTLYSYFHRKGMIYEIWEIIAACEGMQEAGIVEIKNEIFVHPTEEGELLINGVAPEPVHADIPKFPAVHKS
jgi:hypothetical protein